MVQKFTDQSFNEEVLKAEMPVLVDFYADWCEPCKMLDEILSELDKDLPSTVVICKIDIDKNPQVAAAFQVQSVPTIIIFKDRKPIWRQSGVQSKQALIQAIKSV